MSGGLLIRALRDDDLHESRPVPVIPAPDRPHNGLDGGQAWPLREGMAQVEWDNGSTTVQRIESLWIVEGDDDE